MPTPLHPLASASKTKRQSSLPLHVAQASTALLDGAAPRASAQGRPQVRRLPAGRATDRGHGSGSHRACYRRNLVLAGRLAVACAPRITTSKRAAEARRMPWQPRSKAGCDAQGWPVMRSSSLE